MYTKYFIITTVEVYIYENRTVYQDIKTLKIFKITIHGKNLIDYRYTIYQALCSYVL